MKKKLTFEASMCTTLYASAALAGVTGVAVKTLQQRQAT